MNVWEKVTGSDLTRDWKEFEARAEVLPSDYQLAWDEIKVQLLPHGAFTGRNLMPVLDGVLGLFEETAADGQSAREAVGDDIAGFCADGSPGPRRQRRGRVLGRTTIDQMLTWQGNGDALPTTMRHVAHCGAHP